MAQGFSISVKLVLWNANKNVKFTESFVQLAEREYIFMEWIEWIEAKMET